MQQGAPMYHRVTGVLAVAGIVTLLSACSDTIPPSSSAVPRGKPIDPAIRSPFQQKAGPSRRDTPWRVMSDSALAVKVDEAGGRVFVGFKDPTALEGVNDSGRVLVTPASVLAGKAHLRSLGAVFEIEFVDMPSVVTRIPGRLVPELRHNPLIEYIEPIFPFQSHAQTITWNVQRVQAPSAWSYSAGSGAKLLILDSGIESTHPDLSPAVVQSCESPPGTGLDGSGHGTSVAGVAAAVNNDIQIVGVAYAVALWTSKVNIGNTNTIDPGYATCGVQFGRVNGVHAINMSFGGTTSYASLTDQINRAYNENGIVLVASAGNDYAGPVSYPANLANVIAVSATDISDNLAAFSNVGSEVELAAPGVGITSTCLGGTTCSVNGTSFAAPHVAAAAALLKAYNPSWSNVEIRRRLDIGATDLGAVGQDIQFGYGLLNIPAAINAPPALYVTISGATTIKTAGNYSWSCSASGGVGGFSYTWERSDNNGAYYWVASGTSYSSWVDASSGPQFSLLCSVTSGTQTASDVHAVNVVIPPT